MNKKQVFKLGVCPIGKVLFNHEDTVRQKNMMYKKLDELGIEYVSIEGDVPDGLVRTMDQVEIVVKALKAKGADALFIPHCNYGTEGAAASIARAMDMPTLLWASRDEYPVADGSRLRDSQCGCFATSRVLHLMGVKFDYINNCHVDHPDFAKGLDRFIRAARIVKRVKTARLGQLGMRIPFFWCTINDEATLLKRFGTQVESMDIMDILPRVDEKLKKEHKLYEERLKNIPWIDYSNISNYEGMYKSLCLSDVLVELADELRLDAYGFQLYNGILNYVGEGGGLGLLELEEHLPVAAETDMYGALSGIIAEAAQGETEPSMCLEYTIRHPEEENTILMWHAFAAPSQRHPSVEKIKMLEPSILRGFPPCSPKFELREGDMTICRFDGLDGKFYLGSGEGVSKKSINTREVYTWLEVENWKRWERKLIEHPFIHHSACVYGRYSDSIELAAKFLGVESVRFDKD